MKHYPHHIGDFDKATRHLTRLERSVYRDLLDLYYDTEAQISLDIEAVCRRIIARSNEESTAVQQVLNEFFTKTPTGWYHDRCEQEIAAYHANTSQKALAGKASAEAKRLKKEQALNGKATAVQQPLNSVETAGNGTPTNQSTNQPINHQPSTKESAPRKRGAKFCPDDFVVTAEMAEWARAAHPGVDLLAQTSAFRDWEFKDSKTDWPKAWRNWIRRSAPTTQQARASPHGVNRQEAQEARNRAVLDQYLADEAPNAATGQTEILDAHH